MGRTACIEPQCLYKGALYLTMSVQGSLYLYLTMHVQGCIVPLPYYA